MTIIRFNNLKIVTILILLGGCMSSQKEADPYKEGEVVTWKFNDQFILKTKLGARRTHISTGPHDAEFYRPESEHYVGQFPVDYVPEQFAKLTKAQARQMQPVAIIAGQQLEFNLMLNGSTVQATDKIIESEHGLDHPDQVKVRINFTGSKTDTYHSYRIFEESDEAKYDKDSSSKYSLKCNIFTKTNGLLCFGKSDYPNISGVYFTFRDKDWVVGESQESLFGGVKVEWRIESKNLKHWKEIDLAIWRLLDEWNISSLKV